MKSESKMANFAEIELIYATGRAGQKIRPQEKATNDREVVAACLRWHTAHARRLEIGATKRRMDNATKEAYDRNGFHPSDPGYLEACRVRIAASEAGERLTPAKRTELAALRALAAICAKVRGSQGRIADADVIDVPMRLTHEQA